jgi:hypothetical protein
MCSIVLCLVRFVFLIFLAFSCMCLTVLFDLCQMLLMCLWIVHSWLPLRFSLTFMYCTLEYIPGLQYLGKFLKQGWYVELTTLTNLYSLVNVGSTVQYTVTWYQGQETVHVCTVSKNIYHITVFNRIIRTKLYTCFNIYIIPCVSYILIILEMCWKFPCMQHQF